MKQIDLMIKKHEDILHKLYTFKANNSSLVDIALKNNDDELFDELIKYGTFPKFWNTYNLKKIFLVINHDQNELIKLIGKLKLKQSEYSKILNYVKKENMKDVLLKTINHLHNPEKYLFNSNLSISIIKEYLQKYPQKSKFFRIRNCDSELENFLVKNHPQYFFYYSHMTRVIFDNFTGNCNYDKINLDGSCKCKLESYTYRFRVDKFLNKYADSKKIDVFDILKTFHKNYLEYYFYAIGKDKLEEDKNILYKHFIDLYKINCNDIIINLVKEGFNVNYQDDEGNTFLHKNNSLKNDNQFMTLLKACGFDFTIKNNKGKLWSDI